MQIELDNPTELTPALRVPGCCRAAEMTINGETVLVAPALQKGYTKLRRTWQAGDIIELDLPMPVERVQAQPNVRANCGRAALQRGPLVYCLEEIDNGQNLNDLVLAREENLEVQFEKDLLGGVAVITGTAKRRAMDEWKGALYHTDSSKSKTVSFKAIPYFAWDNRATGEMLVWVREA